MYCDVHRHVFFLELHLVLIECDRGYLEMLKFLQTHLCTP